MGLLLPDIRYALRMLRKSPGFAAVVVFTLALGIGANTALFSVVNGVLLAALPYPQPGQLVTLSESKPNFEQGSISYLNFRDWQKLNHTFSSVAAYRGYSFSLTGAGEAEQVSSEFVSSDLFPMLGVKPLMGRTFAVGEDQVGAAPVAMISASLWRRKFSSAPDILTKGITLDGRVYSIVGIVPDNFHFVVPSFPANRDAFVPLGQWNNPLLLQRAAGIGIHGVARLKPGVKFEQAQADMDNVARNLADAFPGANKDIGAKLFPLKQQMVGEVEPYLLALLGGVGFVLLIACVNVANLSLARSTGRAREFAVRAALGASPSRVIRQLLTESALLALAGGGLGLLFAAWGTRAALAVLPAALPRAEQIGIDGRVLLFTAFISLAAGILFGLAPAFKTSRPDLQESLKEGGRGASGPRQRTQSIFVIAEMAMAVVLLAGAGLMIRSLTRLWSVDPGFNPQNVSTFGFSLSPAMLNAPPDAIRAALRAYDDKLLATPGVKAVSLTWGAVPMNGDDEQLFWLNGQPRPASENDMNWAIDYIVEPGYLDVMGIPLQRGRFFTPQDDEHSPPMVVIDDVFARKYFPGQNPVGQRINLNLTGAQAVIVGVVGHVKQWGLDADDVQTLRAQLYLPCMQMPDNFIALSPTGSAMVVRSDGSAGLFHSIQQVTQQTNSEQVVFGEQTMDQIIAASLAARRFAMILFGIFAALAVLLAGIGIYGVISYVTGQQTREIGVRIALGARRLDILQLILAGGGKLVLAGLGLGLIAALGLSRFMGSLLYGVSAADPLTFAGVALLLGLIALAACYVPARRATKIDPIVALRYE